jgi:predicted hotdog family 3-hydroxylacyl-ACP dehydratase
MRMAGEARTMAQSNGFILKFDACENRYRLTHKLGAWCFCNNTAHAIRVMTGWVEALNQTDAIRNALFTTENV